MANPRWSFAPIWGLGSSPSPNSLNKTRFLALSLQEINLTEFTSSILQSATPISYCVFAFECSESDTMGARLPSMIVGAKQILRLQSRITREKPDVPKGHIAVYVGETRRKRFVVPILVLNHPSFKDLLKRAEEEFGFDHPMGGLTIPCREDTFLNLTSRLQALIIGD
ncbi:hypothetical protein V6N12_055899 [Hibiscus sabdariffa]|uniref:Uncharacterized protein n=1 Tax=Hibiscus sabdariffa TaxID=183260 RepID=A0ABR2CRK5_9ROSI